MDSDLKSSENALNGETGNFPRVGIVGTGPSGLMAAYVLAAAGLKVTVFEKRKSAGRKLLIAGASGLNISYDCEPDIMPEQYVGNPDFFKKIFAEFSRENWLAFIHQLGLETFKGTSRRYFVREMKAANLLRAWQASLKELGVEFQFGKELVDFQASPADRSVTLVFQTGETAQFAAAGFFLGGGSWEPEEKPLRWPKVFIEKKLAFQAFEPSNTGFEVAWPEALLKEAEGKPLKNITLTTGRGTKKGELMITNYGLEGTPIYAIGQAGQVYLDLKPDLTAPDILAKLNSAKRENLAPIRLISKYLNLCEASLALLFHLSTPAHKKDLSQMVALIKKFPIRLNDKRPLDESISSSGGLDWAALTPELMLRNYPGVFAGGEMLNWDTTTGGFLIQACVSQGHFVGKQMRLYLESGK